MAAKKIDGKAELAKLVGQCVSFLNDELPGMIAGSVELRFDRFMEYYYEQAAADFREFARVFTVLSASAAFVKHDEPLNEFVADIKRALDQYNGKLKHSVAEKVKQEEQGPLYSNYIKAECIGDRIKVVCNEGSRGMIEATSIHYADALLSVIDTLGSGKISNTVIVCNCTGNGCSAPTAELKLKFELRGDNWQAVLDRGGRAFVGPPAKTKFEALRRYITKFANDQDAIINIVIPDVN